MTTKTQRVLVVGQGYSISDAYPTRKQGKYRIWRISGVSQTLEYHRPSTKKLKLVGILGHTYWAADQTWHYDVYALTAEQEQAILARENEKRKAALDPANLDALDRAEQEQAAFEQAWERGEL